jgi:hypothetical protein
MPDRNFQQMTGDKQPSLTSKTDQEGQGMVELTFTFMLFVTLLGAIAILAWIFFSQASIVHATRQGTRHLMAHPVLPDNKEVFDTADAEATWVVTSSVPLLDWREMDITISPPLEERLPGTYVAIQIEYDIPLPTIEIPLGFTDDVITVVRPMRLHALSRRSLD